MPNKENIENLKVLKEQVAKARSIIFADYKGLGVNDINDLRQKLRGADAEMVVAKNTLMGIALEEEKLDSKQAEEELKGPTAAIFGFSDAIAPIKVLTEFAKTLELPKIKGGFVEGMFSTASQIQVLSTLPGREELLAKVVGSMQAPIRGVVNVFSGTQAKFVRVLSAVAEKKSA